ncbi:amidase [Thalassobaculum sp. OXR-137]|uniref:amidase n=1 Tax=Thalassobaculum sp. OXR-137 TaxID=3100173 RepID=UPI002AC9D11B|nr:amidase [Thalassobaculum sp. OXR-137]WPZ32650.1 amidase [Thalassobaculum sp. OXR-137]
MTVSDPYRLTAGEAAAAMAQGSLTAVDLLTSVLSRIDAREPSVRAWLHVDREGAMAEAKRLDAERAAGTVRGPLHGIPIGIKDVIDVAGMPGTHNSPLHQGRVPVDDAGCVALMRAAGAIPLGKLDTVEFAALGHLPKTVNPHRPTHTAGGSSSGSGAAVGDLHVPISFGTQTGGSVMRPASYCGTYALKPTWGVVSREGAKLFAASLDTIGWYARSVQDLRLVAAASGIADQTGTPRDVASLRIAICLTPYADKARDGALGVLTRAAEALTAAGATVERLELPDSFAGIDEAKDTIMRGEGRAAFLPALLTRGDDLHDTLRGIAEYRTGITPLTLKAAQDYAAHLRLAYEGHYRGFDAVLTFGATGEADEGLESTGNSVFNSLWTLLHLPVVGVPAGDGPTGLPIGVQFVGFRHGDDALLDVAAAAAPVVDPWHGKVRVPAG